MKLITEQIDDVKIITESRNGKKGLYIEGVFLQGDIKNRNNRVYPFPILEKEVNRYMKDYVNQGRAVGELGHPDGPTVNLDRVSHKIISLRQEGKNFIGKAKILESTPMGSIAKSLLNEGVKLGVSSRAVGSLMQHKEGFNVVGEDLYIATAADIVADPSAPDAFVEGIMEGADWVYNPYTKEWFVESIKNNIENLYETRQVTEEKLLEQFNNYLNSL